MPIQNNNSIPVNRGQFVLWNKINENEIKSYTENLEILSYEYMVENIACSHDRQYLDCSNDKLDYELKYFQESIETASHDLYNENLDFKPKQVVGWNEHCKEAYAIARNKFHKWDSNGRVRLGIEYDEMKLSRAEFRRELKFCRNNELNLKKGYIANSFKLKNKNKFWKDVNKIKSSKCKNSTCIDGLQDPLDIANLFSEKYKSILDDPSCQIKPKNFDLKYFLLDFNTYLPNDKITIQDIDNAIDKLSTGIGWDYVHSNHIKHIGKNGRKFLSRLFSSFITHNYIPKDLLIGQIRPLVKDRLKDLTLSGNYRPIMNSSNLLKIFEYCILFKLEKKIKLSPRQLGFIKKTSCLMASSILRETAFNYTTAGSNVHCAFIDLTKAFDKINFYILLEKMIDKNIPPPLIKIIRTMYENQYVNVCYNNTESNFWKIGNGARQGAILSPLIFNFYVNDILEAITEMDGCKVGFYKVNILGYADDIVLLAPSVENLQKILNKIYIMISSHSLVINLNKSVYMVFRTKKYKNYQMRCSVNINGYQLKLVRKYTYLGCIISDNLSVSDDIKKCDEAFLKQFYSIYRKFNFLDFKVMKFLFESHAMSFYGSELWYDTSGCKNDFKVLGITYHKAVKKMKKFPWRESNHYTCNTAGLPVFKHLINRKVISFLTNILNTSSICMMPLKAYYKYDSQISKCVNETFSNEYGLDNALDNDLDAIKSRIKFVQNQRNNSYL
jgi:hypothetical protein